MPDECLPDCEGKECGPDGCGNVCGECPEGHLCLVQGTCLCVPACDEKECGDDGCGGECGGCPDGYICSDFHCEPGPCEPDCADMACGDDGCGGTCGECEESYLCEEGACVCPGPVCKEVCCPEHAVCNAHDLCCLTVCGENECGPDGCGGICGECGEGEECLDGTCCALDCEGKECGPDGSGGQCGLCLEPNVCLDDGSCICFPDCLGKECGPDGCGDVCGECAGDNGLCLIDGSCVCFGNCEGKECGDDGCGESCGDCGEGDVCEEGACVPPPPPTIVLPYLQQLPLGPWEPFSVDFEVSGWELDSDEGDSIVCYVDGEEAGTFLESPFTSDGVSPGWHDVCCALMHDGAPLPFCSAADCRSIRAVQPCLGANDTTTCDDNSPFSVDACHAIGGGQFECNYGPAPGDWCHMDFECDCEDGVWETCDVDTLTCGG